MSKGKGPYLPDYDTMIQAGIDPKTGQPTRAVDNKAQISFKQSLKRYLRIIDEQDAVNRYVWYNLPNNITSQELERLLYYKGQLCFFYLEDVDEFYFMPYALDGSIDFYGRFNRIHPVPMTSGVEDKEPSDEVKKQAGYLSTLKLNVVYGIKDIENIKGEDLKSFLTENTVLLHDYSKQSAQTITARYLLNDNLLDTMANMLPFMNTKLMLSTGVKGVRVNDGDQGSDILKQGLKIENYALKGQPWIPLISALEFQELANNNGGSAQDYLLALQALDNFRLSGYGIDNGGLFEKKAHELQSQADLNGGPVGLVLQDGLSIRQNFCNIVNSIWDLDLWCEPAENIKGMDSDGDGVVYDENMEGEHSGVETESEGGTSNE